MGAMLECARGWVDGWVGNRAGRWWFVGGDGCGDSR